MNSSLAGHDLGLANDALEIDNAVALLRGGRIVAFPTETVYGLGADAENCQAVQRIFAVKARPQRHPLITHLADTETLDYWVREIPPAARRLAAHFWPGPLTLVLRRSSRVPDLISGGLDTIGIRVPSHPVAKQLLRAFKGGIAAPSANRFGRISPTSAAHVREELGTGPDLILDGGPCQVGVKSTIVSLAGQRPLLLRPGSIGVSALQDVLGEELCPADENDAQLRAPGRLAVHYAPSTPAVLLPSAQLIASQTAYGDDVALLCLEETAAALVGSRCHCQHVANDPPAYGQRLYALLRQLDSGRFRLILIEEPPATEPWQAINDRLRRATSKSSQLDFTERQPTT